MLNRHPQGASGRGASHSPARRTGEGHPGTDGHGLARTRTRRPDGLPSPSHGEATVTDAESFPAVYTRCRTEVLNLVSPDA
jgi:hypothetical protein